MERGNKNFSAKSGVISDQGNSCGEQVKIRQVILIYGLLPKHLTNHPVYGVMVGEISNHVFQP